MHPTLLAIAVAAVPLLAVLRIILLLPARRPAKALAKRQSNETCSLGIFLGSGGHTAEMCTLLSSTSFSRYTPRTYIYCPGDEHSLRLVRELEERKAMEGGSNKKTRYSFLPLPRARKVKQPFMTAVFTSFGTLIVAIVSIFVAPLLRNPLQPGFEVLLVNGPGTCVMVVAVCWIRRILGLRYTKIIYVESFARVISLSLSAKLLRPFVDSFVVQWPQLAPHATVKASNQTPGQELASAPPSERSAGVKRWLAGRTVYRGWLV